jgi:hypothetical protein
MAVRRSAARRPAITRRGAPNLAAVRKALTRISTRARPLPRLKQEQIQLLHATESRAGAGKRNVASSRRFLAIEKLQVLKPKMAARNQPNWVRALAQKKVKDRVAVESALDRVTRFPGKSSLMVAQQVLNDFGAKKGGGALLRKMVTQKLVTQLIKKGG